MAPKHLDRDVKVIQESKAKQELEGKYLMMIFF